MTGLNSVVVGANRPNICFMSLERVIVTPRLIW